MIRQFDVILTWPKHPTGFIGLLSRIITWVTRKGPSHVRTYIKGLYKDYDFFEVTYPHSRFGYMSEVDPKEYRIEIGRHRGLPSPLPKELSDIAILEMWKIEGSNYDAFELWEHLLDEAGIDSIDNSVPNKYVCSSGNGHIMYWMGYPWHIKGKIVSLLSPQDIRESDEYVRERR